MKSIFFHGNFCTFALTFRKDMEEQFDIRDYRPSGKERDFENALRPLQFEDFSGQDKVVDNLRIFVKAARLRAEAQGGRQPAYLCQGCTPAGGGSGPRAAARTSRTGKDYIEQYHCQRTGGRFQGDFGTGT